MGAMFFFCEPLRTLALTSSGFSRRTRGFFSGAFIFHTTIGELTTPLLGYLVDATYEAFTVSTTAFIKFLAA
uniref:Putative secreted protein n=1 Tax=Rhipicephalus microplus TaxID=6941 RepID=A0A6M2DBP6_RHIMP